MQSIINPVLCPIPACRREKNESVEEIEEVKKTHKNKNKMVVEPLPILDFLEILPKVAKYRRQRLSSGKCCTCSMSQHYRLPPLMIGLRIFLLCSY